ncbi:MAG: adenosylcobinamide-GDP ribazoletransferase [Actinomycetota bacterium]|nr:adenosylcobinamide-GDP ribazoletransferase [Actinomycetota bacterium]
MRSLRAAVVFLTRIPVGVGRKGPPPLSQAVPWFPMVGTIVGCLVGVVYLLASQALPATVASVVAVAFGIAITGAFHLDGLADSADAFAGGTTVERRFEILKDSRLGTYGTSALVLVLFLEVAALATLAPRTGLIALVTAHGIGRASAVGVMVLTRNTAKEGLGADYLADLSRIRGALGIAVVVGVAVLLNGSDGALLIAFALPASLLTWAWSYRSIGGVVGDSLGAIAQLSQTSVLVAATALNS